MNNMTQPEPDSRRFAGIDKLFDLMKSDLGTQQTEEMKQFYQHMSSQIKTLCNEEKSPNKADGALKSQLLLSLLQMHKNQIMQQSVGYPALAIKLKPRTTRLQRTIQSQKDQSVNPLQMIKVKEQKAGETKIKTLELVFDFLAAKLSESAQKIVIFTNEGSLVWAHHRGLPIEILREEPGQEEITC